MRIHPRFLFWILCLLSFALLGSHLLIPIINFGQLTKQTFVDEMIRGLINHDVIRGFFPIRHFPELNHPGLIPWAEEFPLFHWIVAFITRLLNGCSLNSNPILIAKFLNLGAFIAIISGFFQLGKSLFQNQKSEASWIFATIAVLYPAFRMYSVEIMPDLWMIAGCVWAIERTLKKKPFSAAILLAFATLFKYYAAFTAFGIFLNYSHQALKTRDRKEGKHAVFIGLSILPCLIYILSFIKLGIPNPITEYRASGDSGHFSSIQGILDPYPWSRALLWIFVKNGTLFATVLAAYGWYTRRKQIPSLLISLMIGWSFFPLLFLKSFSIHDYYGLQASIGVAIFAAMGMTQLFLDQKTRLVHGSTILFAFWGFAHAANMSKPNTDFNQIIKDYPSFISKLEKKPEWGLSISGISAPVIPHFVRLDSWIVSFHDLDSPLLLQKLSDSRVDLVMIHGFHSQSTDLEKSIQLVEKNTNFKLLIDQRYPTSRLVIFAKNR